MNICSPGTLSTAKSAWHTNIATVVHMKRQKARKQATKEGGKQKVEEEEETKIGIVNRRRGR